MVATEKFETDTDSRMQDGCLEVIRNKVKTPFISVTANIYTFLQLFPCFFSMLQHA